MGLFRLFTAFIGLLAVPSCIVDHAAKVQVLWVHLNIARPTMERRDRPGAHNLEAVGNRLNGGSLAAIVLRKAGHSRLTAGWTP